MSPFDSKDFQVLFRTRILGIMSLQIQLLIIGWKAYELSRDPLILGLMGLVEAVPAIGFAFFAGHIVDHGRPVQIYFRSLCVLLLNSLFIFAAVSTRLDLSNTARISMLLFGMFVMGIFKAFIGPSIFSIFPHVVQKAQLPSAMAWNSTSFQIASVVGPAVGGLIYGHFGTNAAFTAPVVLLVLAVLSCSRFSAISSAIVNNRNREQLYLSFKLAIDFIRGQKIMFSTMTLDMFAVLFGGATALLPVFADKVLATNAAGLGFLRAASAAGSAAVGIYFAKRPMVSVSGSKLIISVMAFGVTTICFALSKSYLLSLFLLLLIGIFDGMSSIMRATILQALTPEHMRGRISALNSIFITSSNEIGSFESGLAAKLLGLVPSVVFGGSMTLMISLFIRSKFPALANMNLRVDK
jgi:MFS family permease